MDCGLGAAEAPRAKVAAVRRRDQRFRARPAEDVARRDQPEASVAREEALEHLFAFAPQERARGVDEAALRRDEGRGRTEQSALRLAERRDLGRDETPADLGVAPDRPSAGAGRVDEHADGGLLRTPSAPRPARGDRRRSPGCCSRPRASPGGAAPRASTEPRRARRRARARPAAGHGETEAALPPAPAHASMTNEPGGGATSSDTIWDASSWTSKSPRAKACVRNADDRPSRVIPRTACAVGRAATPSAPSAPRCTLRAST